MDFCQELHERMWTLSTIQNQPVPISPCLNAHQICKSYMTFCPLFHGFNHGPPLCRWIWFYLGHGRPRAFKGGDFNPLHKDIDCWRSCTTPIGQLIQMIWTTQQDYFWLRTPIYCSIIPRNDEITWNHLCSHHCLPSVTNSLLSSLFLFLSLSFFLSFSYAWTLMCTLSPFLFFSSVLLFCW